MPTIIGVVVVLVIIGFLSWYLWKKYGTSLCQSGPNAGQTEDNEMTDFGQRTDNNGNEQPREHLTEIAVVTSNGHHYTLLQSNDAIRTGDKF